MASRRQAKALLDYHAEQLMAYPNVVAVAIGRKQRCGQIEGRDWVLRVHVTRKTKRRTHRSVPEELPAPPDRPSLGAIRTDVIETGATELHADVLPGMRVRVGGTGAVGCVLEDTYCQRFILTAGHVVSPTLVVDRAHNGNLGFDNPHRAYVNGRSKLVGLCVRCSQPKPFIDLALILMTAGKAGPIAEIAGVRDVEKERLLPAEQIKIIHPRGTIHTAYQDGADADGKVSFKYPKPKGRGTVKVVFDKIVFYPRSGVNARTEKCDKLKRGDSGSAVVDGENRLIGIHIGASTGTPTGGNTMLLGYAIACRAARAWVSGMSVVTRRGKVPL